MSDELVRIWGIGPVAASRLIKAGITTIDQLAAAQPTELAFVKGIGIPSAKKIIANAKHLMTLEKGLTIVLDHIKANFVQNCPKCGSGLEKRYIIINITNRIHVLQCSTCKFYLPF